MSRRPETTLTQKGQVTIPIGVRKAMGLKPRDKIHFEFDAETHVALLRRVSSTLADGYGAVRPRTNPEDFKDLREKFEEGVAEEIAEEA